MNEELLANLLGGVAGTILLVSGLPVLREQMRPGATSSSGERFSRFLIGVGNALWVGYGLLNGQWVLAVMCGSQVVINGWALAIMTSRAWTQPLRWKGRRCG